ncbi:hypothetical protein [Nocardia sp. IFM 10818]
MDIGTVDEVGEFHRCTEDLDDQLERIETAYNEDPLGDGEGRWMYMRWLRDTPLGVMQANSLSEDRIASFDVFY